MFEVGRLGQLARIVHVDLGAVGQVGPVGHRRGGGDEGQVELALEPLADDLHVQQAEEPAPEPEPEGAGRLGLIGEAGVVEPELLQGVPEVGQLVPVDGEQPAEHHGLGVAVAGQRPEWPGAAAVVTVSPDRAPPTSLMPAMR